MSTLSATNDALAGSQFQAVVQATGLDVSRLGQVAQLQLAVAELYVNAPPGSIAAGDIASGTFGSNIPDTGAYLFPAAVTVATSLTLTNGLLTTTRSSSQLVARLQRDGSNRHDINVTTAGVVTWDAVGSAPSYAWDFNGVDIWRIDASGNLTGIAKPSAVGTTPGTTTTASAVTTGAGGNTTIATTGVGGAGGAWSLTTGAGGTAASAVTAATGGAGGAITLTTGAGTATAVVGAGTGTGGASGAFAIVTGVGGAASTSTGANQGGASGAFSVTTGVGGAATNGSANTGGASGAITLLTGNGGAGATAAGNSGAITLQTGTSGATAGTILLKPAGTTRLEVTTAGADVTGTATVTSASASSLAVGRLGATTPAFLVDSSAGTQAAGLSVTGAASGGTVALTAIDSGGATNVTLNAKGTGTIGIGTVSTGNITLGSFVVTNAAAVTLTGGAGNMTIVSGTGNSRTLTLQTTTSGGTATSAIAIDAVQDVTVSSGHLVMTNGKTVKCGVSTTAAASINFGNAGTAPSSPNNGDAWIESNTLKIRLNGATVTVQTA